MSSITPIARAAAPSSPPGKPNPGRKHAPNPKLSPKVAEIAGSAGSSGSTAPNHLKTKVSFSSDPGTPAVGSGGSTGSITFDTAGDEESRAARGARSRKVTEADLGDGLLSRPPMNDPFAVLTDAELEVAIRLSGATASGEDFLTILPFRGNPPPPSALRFGELPQPSQVWCYRDADGHPVVMAARYDFVAADGMVKKEIRPWTYGRRVWTTKDGTRKQGTRWHCKAPPEPRPLFGLDRLAARPDAAVLVCEGEKAADAAGLIFPEFVCVTSQGGAKAPAKSDWSPLHGRTVTIWPDNDESGMDYALKVAELATAAGAVCVRCVDVPAKWHAGWDLADPLPEGVPSSRLRDLLDDAPDSAPAELPPGFRLNSKGLFFFPEPTEKDPDPRPTFVAAAFRPIGETRSECGEAWGILMRWRDREGFTHKWAVPRRLIHRPGNEIAEELEHAGLSCGSGGRAHQLLKNFIGGIKLNRLLRCVARTGWHLAATAPVFVLPGGDAFGRGAADVILQGEHATADIAYRASGTLAGWQNTVAKLAVGNDRLALFVCAAFAGPLLDVMGEPSGGVHLVGNSRTGKSTAAIIAASVWGRPTADALMRQWRGTANGLEATAADTSDALLILDEMGQADAREVADVVYMLANESGKQRASRTGTARRRQNWRTLFLSTGELTLAAKMGEAGKRGMAGLDVRLVNLPADAGAGLGVFQNLHGRANPALLAEELRETARQNHGTAARAFLVRLAEDRATNAAELRETLDGLRTRFLDDHVPAGSAAQVRSVAARFALIGIAGELARDYGVLPWPAGEALRAAGVCLAAWIAERGGTGSGEDAAALAQVRVFFEMHGESRFTPLTRTSSSTSDIGAPESARTINRAGFRRQLTGGDDRWEYLVLPEAWQTEICKGLDARRTADLLIARGFLLRSDDRHRAGVVNIPGEGKRRVYRITGAIIGGDPSEGGTDGAI